MKEEKQRTLRQNKALHKWFKESADTLNEHGADMQMILAKRLSVWWSEETFKEALFKQFIRRVYIKDSTTELSTKQLTESVQMVTDVIARETGVVLPEFPSTESLINQQRGVKRVSNSNK